MVIGESGVGKSHGIREFIHRTEKLDGDIINTEG